MNDKALVIIHDPAMVESLSRALMRPDLALGFHSTVGAALEALSRNQTAIVFCEARLPDGSFREVVRFLEAAGRKTPLVVCDSFYDRATDAEAATLGACAYLTYPFLRREVQRLADSAVGRHQHEAKRSRAKVAA